MKTKGFYTKLSFTMITFVYIVEIKRVTLKKPSKMLNSLHTGGGVGCKMNATPCVRSLSTFVGWLVVSPMDRAQTRRCSNEHLRDHLR